MLRDIRAALLQDKGLIGWGVDLINIERMECEGNRVEVPLSRVPLTLCNRAALAQWQSVAF